MKNERGFTLIELLVVIAIIAVLFGIAALALNNVGDNAKRETAKAEADIVQTAIDVYMAVNSTTTVTGSTGNEKAGPNTPGFGEYLRRTSRFYVEWDGSGNVVEVCEDSGCASGDDPLWTR
jgi:prepilin-type N-terminal cleavage/methylation domain-containing protein